MNKVKQAIILAFFIGVTGCSTTVINKNPQAITLHARSAVGVMPMENHTQTPQAGEKVAAIVSGFLQTKGIGNVKIYQSNVACDKILSCPTTNLSIPAIFNWARKNNIDYVVLGTVNEWSYKVGLDGEPEVNITLKLIGVDSGKTIWSAVGSKTGGSRSGLGNIGHELIDRLLSPIIIIN